MNKTLSAIIGTIALLFIGFLVYKVLQVSISNIDKVNPTVLAALIAGTITVIGYFITRYFEKQKTIDQQLREKKIPIYESFLNILSKMLITVKNKEKMSDEELLSFFANFTERSLLWMSDETLLAYIKWRNNASSKTVDSLIAMEDLLLAFRKDVGHKNKGIKRGDLLSVFINDVPTVLERENLKN